MAITSVRDKSRGTRVIVPFDKENLPIEVVLSILYLGDLDVGYSFPA